MEPELISLSGRDMAALSGETGCDDLLMRSG